MRETFKNVSIFIIFIIGLILWDFAKGHIAQHFDFEHGITGLMCIWSVGVVILYTLLYHFLGKTTEKIIYLSALSSVILIGALVYFEVVPLP